LFQLVVQESIGDLISERALKLADPSGADFKAVVGVTLGQMSLAFLVDLKRLAPTLSADIASKSAGLTRFQRGEDALREE
jgi:hypothetical protein